MVCFEFVGKDFKGVCGQVYLLLEGLGDIRVLLVTRTLYASLRP